MSCFSRSTGPGLQACNWLRLCTALWRCCLSPPCSSTSIWARSAWRAPSRRWPTATSTSTGPRSAIGSGMMRKCSPALAPRATRCGLPNNRPLLSVIKNARPRGRAFCYKEAMRIIGLAGWSGSGKTTLITKLIPRLIARGISVSTLKHAHHGFDLDQPGKDSFFHRTAGATEVIISSAKRWAILHELREQPEWDLAALVGKMSPVDLVLVEGFKRDAFPKLEIHRIANGKPLIHPEDLHIVAVASDSALPAAQVPVVDLNDIEAIADLLLKHAVPI